MVSGETFHGQWKNISSAVEKWKDILLSVEMMMMLIADTMAYLQQFRCFTSRAQVRTRHLVSGDHHTLPQITFQGEKTENTVSV